MGKIAERYISVNLQKSPIELTSGKMPVTPVTVSTPEVHNIEDPKIKLLCDAVDKYPVLSDPEARLLARSLCKLFGWQFNLRGLELLTRRYKALGFDVWDFVSGKPLISSPRNADGPGIYFFGNDGKAYLPDEHLSRKKGSAV